MTLQKKQILYFIFSSLVLLLFAKAIFAQAITKPAVAAFRHVKGTVWVKAGNGSKQPAKSGQQLFFGNIVFTEKSGFAVIMFTNRNQVKLHANSELILHSRLEEQTLFTKLRLNLGKIWLNIIKSSEKTEVHTPNADITVKGTEFITIYLPENVTILGVLSGKVLLSNKQGQEELVESLKKSRVEQNQAPSKPEPFSLQQLHQLWETETATEKTGEIQPELLKLLLDKLSVADSLSSFMIDNYSIRGGTENINKYLKMILEKDLDEIEWEIITDKEGIKRLRLLIKNS